MRTVPSVLDPNFDEEFKIWSQDMDEQLAKIGRDLDELLSDMNVKREVSA
jgi:hypothetical protein